MEEMKAEDERLMQELMKQVLTTKDGRPELSAEELLTEEDKVDEDDDEDDDSDEDHFHDEDSSSAVASPDSSDVTRDEGFEGAFTTNIVRTLGSPVFLNP